MGVENFVDAPVAGKRKTRRARVLLAARLTTQSGEIDVRLRDLSRKGALLECERLPAVGSEVVFTRGSTTVPARVAWAGGNRVGLEFKYMIDETEVLVQLRRTPTEQNSQRFRRPRLFGEDLSESEKKLAKVWGLAVGIKVPGE